MGKIIYVIICLFLLVGCSTDKSRKDQVANTPQKELLKNEHEDTIITKKPSMEVVKPQQAVEKVFAINNKQINITYKGKDRTRIVKATDIFKNIYYVPLETNEMALLKPNPYCMVCKNSYIYTGY